MPISALSRHELERAITPCPMVFTPSASMSEVWAQLVDWKQSHQSCATVAPVFVVSQERLVGWLPIECIVQERLDAITGDPPPRLVADVMVRSPLGLSQLLLTNIFIPLTYLQEFRTQSLPVLDADQHLIGQVSYSSLQAILPPDSLLSHRIATEVAQPAIATELPPSWAALAQLLLEHQTTAVIIVSAGQAIGYLTVWDILNDGTPPSTSRLHPLMMTDRTASLETVRSLMQRHQTDRILLPPPEANSGWQWVTAQALLSVFHPSALYQSLEVQIEQSATRSPDALQSVQTNLESHPSVELRLQQSEQFHRLLLDQISDAVFLTDASGTFHFICPNAHVIFGYSHDEIATMQSIRRLLGDTIVDAAQHLYGQPLSPSDTNKLTNVEQTVIDQHGNAHIVLINVKRVWLDTDLLLYTIRDVTDLKQMERSLQSQESQYQSVVDHLPIGLCICSIDGVIVHCNSQASALLGLSNPEDCTGLTITDRWQWYDESGQRIAENCHPINQVLVTQHAIQNTILSVQSISQTDSIWVSVSAFPLFNPTSALQYAVVTFTDVSDRVHTERELAKSEEQFRQLANHLPEIIWMCDEMGQDFLFISPHYEQLWEQSRTELYTNSEQWLERIHPEDRARVQQRFTTDLRTGRYDQEYRILMADGSIRWIRDRGFPIRDDNGVIFRTAGFTQDITDQKQTESSLRHLNQELEARVEQRTADLYRSERRFRRFFEQSIVGMAIVSPDQTWLEVNDCFCELLGYSADELVEHGWIGVTHPDDVVVEQVSINRILRGESDGYCMDKRFVHRSGHCVQVIISAGCVRQADGSVDYLAQMVLDISDRKQAEAALRQREKRYRNLFENAPISLWEEDFSGAKTYLDDLCHREVITDLDAYLQQHPQVVAECAERVQVLDVNQATLNLYHASDKAQMLTHLRSILKQDTLYGFQKELVAFYSGQVSCTLENQTYDFNGQKKSIILQLFIDPDYVHNWSRVLVAIIDISDRKRTEEALRRSETRLAEAQRVAHVGSWDFDVRTGIATWSAEVCRIFGFDPTDRHPSFEEIRQRIHPDDVWRWENNVQQCLATGCLHHCEFRVQHPDGTIRYVEARGEPSFNDQGQVISLFGISLDLTERQHMELALRRSEATKNAIIRAIPDLLIQMDRDGNKRVMLNADRYENFIQVGDSLPTRLSDVFPEHIAQQRLHHIRTALETRELQVCEYEIQVQGQVRYEESRILPCGQDEVLVISRDITDRRRAESTLRDREGFLRSIYDGIEVGIFVVDVESNGTLRYAGSNPTHERLLNISTDTIIGRTPNEVMEPELAQQVIAHYQTCLRQGDRISYEEQLSFSHQPLWWLTTLTPLRQSNGQIHRIIGTTLNITDSKRRENALQLILEATASSTGSAFFSSCARALSEVLNVSCVLVTAMRDPDRLMVHPLSLWRDGTWHIVENYSLAGTPCESVLNGQVCYYPDGLLDLFPEDLALQQWNVASYMGIPVFHCSGQVIGHLAVMDYHPMQDDPVRDSVMRIFATCIGAELERQQAEQSLQQEVRRSHLLSEITQQIRSSLHAQHIYETTVTLLGRAFQASRCLLHDYIPKPSLNMLKPVAEWLTTDVTSVRQIEIPLTDNPHAQKILDNDRAVVTPDVAQDPLLTDLLPLCESLQIRSMMAVRTSYRGQPNGIIGLHQCDRPREWTRDEVKLLESVAAQVGIAIAQAKLLEQEQQRRQELGRINAELARATRLKDEFLANMSHELRTPLNAIMGLSEGLQEQVFGELSQRQLKTIATIYSSSQHLLDLINDILDLAKVESGTIQLERSLVDVHYLCDSSLIFVRQQATKKQIQLTLSISNNLDAIAVDERRIRQVLINLLNNAVKFTPDGGQVELSVTTVTANQSPFLCFTISDTGIGIAAEQQDQLFKPFVQLDSSLNRQYAGTGLGLALVRQFTELHGGTVGVVSERGQGSRFTVRLPYVTTLRSPAIVPDDVEASRHRQRETSDKSVDLLPNHASDHYHVLIVQPSTVLSVNGQITFTNVTHMLNRVGLATILVQEDEVQSLAMTLHPAFILLDFETLGKSTWALIDRLKHHPQTQHLAIVVMAQTNVRAIALTHGISAYLEKPFRSTDIDDLVKNLYNYVRNDVNKQVHSPLPLQTPAHNSTDSLPSFSKLVNNDSTPSGQCAPKESDSSISQSVASSPCPLILLAEDNEANIATLVNYLELQGYRMTIARTGREAITAMGQEQPDLILMDIQMPEMDGLTAIQQIRLMPNGADLPIIALTALAMPDDRQRCFAAGATDYVAKPVKMRQLREMIHTMLFED